MQLWCGMHIRADMRVGILCAMVPPLLLNQNLSKQTGLGVLSAGSPMALRKQDARLQVWVLLHVRGPWRRGGGGSPCELRAEDLWCVLRFFRGPWRRGGGGSPCELRAEDLWFVLRFFRGPSAMAGRLQGNCLAGVTALWWPPEQQCLTPLRVRVHLGQGGRLCRAQKWDTGNHTTYPVRWCFCMQQYCAVLPRRRHVTLAGIACCEHMVCCACAGVQGMHCGACAGSRRRLVVVYGATMGRGPHRARAPRWHPQGARGARDVVMVLYVFFRCGLLFFWRLYFFS